MRSPGNFYEALARGPKVVVRVKLHAAVHRIELLVRRVREVSKISPIYADVLVDETHDLATR